MRLYRDRTEGGKYLASLLEELRDRPDVRVFALPRGGVPVAFEVARALRAPLDVFLVRKLGVPGQEELAMGAIASGGVRLINEEIVRRLRIPDAAIAAAAAAEKRELERRERLYRRDMAPPEINDKTVILVDDGLATGATMRAAVKAIRASRPAAVIVAAPVGARDTCEALRDEADSVVCGRMPYPFEAVGRWYEIFPQLTDEEVTVFLDRGLSFPDGGRGGSMFRDEASPVFSRAIRARR